LVSNVISLVLNSGPWIRIPANNLEVLPFHFSCNTSPFFTSSSSSFPDTFLILLIKLLKLLIRQTNPHFAQKKNSEYTTFPGRRPAANMKAKSMNRLFLALQAFVLMSVAQDFGGLPRCAVRPLHVHSLIETNSRTTGRSGSAVLPHQRMSAHQHLMHLPQHAMDRFS
jgi:hypothetical protein